MWVTYISSPNRRWPRSRTSQLPQIRQESLRQHRARLTPCRTRGADPCWAPDFSHICQDAYAFGKTVELHTLRHTCAHPHPCKHVPASTRATYTQRVDRIAASILLGTRCSSFAKCHQRVKQGKSYTGSLRVSSFHSRVATTISIKMPIKKKKKSQSWFSPLPLHFRRWFYLFHSLVFTESTWNLEQSSFKRIRQDTQCALISHLLSYRNRHHGHEVYFKASFLSKAFSLFQF